MNELKKLISILVSLVAAPFCHRRYRPYMRLLGFGSFRQLRARLSDPRNIMAATAELLACSELEVALRVAKELNLPCLARVQSVPALTWPIEQDLDLDDFRARAAIPLAPAGIISGVVCVDPWEARELIERLSGNYATTRALNTKLMPIYIAPWSEISQALELSSQLVLQDQLIHQQERDQHLQQLAYKCLAVMLGHAERAEAAWLEVDLRVGGCAYSFPSREGSRAGGQIDGLVREILISILGSKRELAGGSANYEIYLPELKRPLTVICMANEECFRLQFSEVKNKVIPFPEPPKHLPQPLQSAAQLAKIDTPPAQVYSDYVLIVEDNQTFAQVLGKFLEKHEFRTHSFNACKAALDFLNSSLSLPAVIVCDLHLPEMDGMEFTKLIRHSPALAKIPVVILTSDEDIETELKLLGAGADVYLSKDQDPRLLCAHVSKLAAQSIKREAA